MERDSESEREQDHIKMGRAEELDREGGMERERERERKCREHKNINIGDIVVQKSGENIGFEKGGALDRENAGDWRKGESQRERGVLEYGESRIQENRGG